MEQMRGQRQEFNSLRPEVHDVHRRWREVADSYDPPRLLVGETFVRAPRRPVPVLRDGDQLHLDFNIPFAHAPFEAAALRDMIERTEAALPAAARRCGPGATTTSRGSRRGGPTVIPTAHGAR